MRSCFILLITLLLSLSLTAQTDPVVLKPVIAGDSIQPVTKPAPTVAAYNPRKAIIRSAILPGWGQIYNKKYWKLPLVYGALGTTTALFFRNLKQFNEAREAYVLATDGDPLNDEQIKQPYYAVKDQPERIRTFRNQVRQNVDYSVLFFILFWGLNVADAAVDAHLKSFDVSENLSIQFKPFFSPETRSSGIGLVLNFGKTK